MHMWLDHTIVLSPDFKNQLYSRGLQLKIKLDFIKNHVALMSVSVLISHRVRDVIRTSAISARSAQGPPSLSGCEVVLDGFPTANKN